MKLLVVLLVLWLPFSIAALIAIPVSFVATFIDWEYAKKLLKLLDKVMAALLGWSGEYTVSAECGKSNCFLCKWLCTLLNTIDPGHCEGAAKREGLQ